MDGLTYLQQDTWSLLEMIPEELDALADMLEGADATTPTQEWMRGRVLDARHRKDHPIL